MECLIGWLWLKDGVFPAFLPEHRRPGIGLVPCEVFDSAIGIEEDDTAVAFPHRIMHRTVEGDEGGAVEPINHIAPGLAAGRGGDIDWPAVAGADLLLAHA